MASGKNLEKAAQLWCLPQHSNKIMDAEFAKSIATALDEARSEAIEEAANVAESRFADQFGALRITGLRIADAIRKLEEKP